MIHGILDINANTLERAGTELFYLRLNFMCTVSLGGVEEKNLVATQRYETIYRASFSNLAEYESTPFPIRHGIPGGRKETLYREKSFAYMSGRGQRGVAKPPDLSSCWKLKSFRGVGNLSSKRGFPREFIGNQIVDQNYSNSSETVLRRDSRSEIDESTDDDRASILLEITRDEETKHPMDERYRECIGSRLGYDEDIQRGIMMSFYERLVKSRGIKSMLTVIPGFTVRVRYGRSDR